MQISMPNLRHLQRSLRSRIGRRKDNDVIVRAIIPRVGLIRVAHEIQKDRERATQIPTRLQSQVDIRIENHLGQGFMIAVDQRGIVCAVPLPDRM